MSKLSITSALMLVCIFEVVEADGDHIVIFGVGCRRFVEWRMHWHNSGGLLNLDAPCQPEGEALILDRCP